MTRTSDLIAQLIEALENKPRELTITDAYKLGNALHGAMCDTDWRELNWMNITFEDVASEMVVAERNADQPVEIDRHGRPILTDESDALRELRESGGI